MVPSCSHTHSHTLYSPHNTRSLQHKSPSIFLGQNYNFYFNTHTHRASPLDCALSPPPHTYTHRGSPLDCALSPPPHTHTQRLTTRLCSEPCPRRPPRPWPHVSTRPHSLRNTLWNLQRTTCRGSEGVYGVRGCMKWGVYGVRDVWSEGVHGVRGCMEWGGVWGELPEQVRGCLVAPVSEVYCLRGHGLV